MPTHDGVRVHDDQGGAPILPRVGEQHPKQSISVAELGTPRGALEHGQLLTEGQILERDRAVSTADQRERSKRDDERSQHESSCPGTATASTGTGDLILANDRMPIQTYHDLLTQIRDAEHQAALRLAEKLGLRPREPRPTRKRSRR